MWKEELVLIGVLLPKALETETDSRDPRLGRDNERVMPTEYLKEVRIGPSAYQVTKIGTSLTEEEEHDLVNQLIRNIDLLAWAPSDMLRINIRVVCYHLSINPPAKPVEQRKRKFGK